jgi:hypothetical protein
VNHKRFISIKLSPDRHLGNNCDKPRYDETVDWNIIDPSTRLSGIIDH